MSFFLLLTGVLFWIQPEIVRLVFVLISIYSFCIVYSLGAGPIPFTYSAEVFPLSHREVGMSWAVAVRLRTSCADGRPLILW